MIKMIRKGGFLLILMYLVSCATVDELGNAPLWIDDEPVREDDAFLFTARGSSLEILLSDSEQREAALADLFSNMSSLVLEHMGFTESDFDSFPGERDYITRYLGAALREGWEGDLSSEGISWYGLDGEGAGCAARLRYSFSRYDRDQALLRAYLGGDDFSYGDLMSRAADTNKAGYPFSAWQLTMEAAARGIDKGGLIAGYLRDGALIMGTEYLSRTEVPELQGPDEIILGSRRSWTYRFSLSLSPAADDLDRVAWSVDFRVPRRFGEVDNTFISLYSERSGETEFSYPFPGSEGTGRVIFALDPSAYDVVLEPVLSGDEMVTAPMEKQMDRFIREKSFPVRRDRSVLRTGLIIEDRDVAGKLLISRTTEESALAALLESNYTVEVIDFDLERLEDFSELEIIREFNSLYNNNYDIILYCRAGIRDFNETGGLYQVTAGAGLYEADLWEHRVILLEETEQSVSGSDPARLVTSAFYQLGVDIARICLEQNND